MRTLLVLFLLLFARDLSVYDFGPLTIDGKVFDFSKLRGKKILIVNTASECGYTYQYEGLEELSRKYKDKLVVVAFPANNFGRQEPGTNTEIKEFCSKKYDVTFPLMSKISVKGDDIDPLFKWLTEQTNPDFTGDIKWNFEKFLIDENGRLLHRYRSKTKPMDGELTGAIESNQ